MDKISDEQTLKWLATPVLTRKRAMINTVDREDSWRVPKYKVMRFRRQVHQPSFGNIDKLPPELLWMVFSHLTCGDLEALHSCSTGGRMAVLAFPLYHALLKYAPTILAILKETRLAQTFTIAQIYETFTSPLCTTCSHFGGYVFLPSFTRCCIHCAETELKFLPISRDGARIEFGVKGKKIFDRLPQLSNIEGYYSSFLGEIKYYTQRLTLFSRELVEKVRNPKHTLDYARQRHRYFGESSIQTYQRYMALTPLACFIPKSASMEKGMYCVGCDLRAKEHGFCQGTDISEYRNYKPRLEYVTDGCTTKCWPKEPREQCVLITEQDRQYDSRHILGHIQGCEAAQALLKVKWAQWQKKSSATNS